MTGELRVIATAGHVDHGKSALIARLTGRDPDRWTEEKRRGLTIDLGYAWCTLPSGCEIGFVDVPGHERFIANMLAGVGPVRLVLFVVAADEGWARQSEEHLQILDVLGVQSGVVALTKADLVDPEMLAVAQDEVRDRLDGSVLAGASVVPVSSETGEGVAALVDALDVMIASADPPEVARVRLFVDRVFSIKGAGTVVTGTLSGDRLEVGSEVELYPTDRRARIRSLQTHERAETAADPVSRVAANLVGIDRDELRRGNVLAMPGAWRPTRVFEGRLRTVRGIEHGITARGAYLLHTGAEESEARIRLYGTTKLERGDEAFVRISIGRPLILDVGDRFVLRDAGRHETVGGGVILDVAPPLRSGGDPVGRLQARAAADRSELTALLIHERRAVTVAEAELLTGSRVDPTIATGAWLVAPEVRAEVERTVIGALETHHAEHPLSPGSDVAQIRRGVVATLRGMRAPTDPSLVDALVEDLADRELTTIDASTIRLANHRVDLDDRDEELGRLLREIGGSDEATPPDVHSLIERGIDREVIQAAVQTGRVVRLSVDLVVTPALVERATMAITATGPAGITVSQLREALGTTRKYAIPLMEWLDRQGITRRQGDVRFLRSV